MSFSLVSVLTLAPVYALALGLAVWLVLPPGDRVGRRDARPGRNSAGLRPHLRTRAAGRLRPRLRSRTRPHPRRWWTAVGVAAVVGAGAGALVSWWVGDVQAALDVPPTWVDRAWVSALGAGLAVAVVAAVRGGAGRRVVAGLGVVVFALSTGLAVNRDAGLFPTVGALLGVSHVAPLTLPPAQHGVSAGDATTASGTLPAEWTPPAELPRHGRLGSVVIPATDSHFRARPALVWLPPAALTADPPALPVVVALSGQGPGAAPENLVDAGHLDDQLDALAAQHDGLAPIVVMPDQLGRPTSNPMCVDGELGDSATWLTRDVPAWVTAHLDVQRSPAAWAIAGFSQGGTCSVQLATGHPDVFGSFVDVSGQLGPLLDGGVDRTIARGFDGSRAAYDAAQPVAVMRAHGRYADLGGFFAVGADDSRYGPVQPVVSAAAQAAGIDVTRLTVPGSGHDWHTASVGLAAGLRWLWPRLGLGAVVGG
ncbi:hypothetical protein ASF82_12950 [Frigoribacterium sp. Leaf164]|uniref:alpha/beta hydrolase n=1 Tax=Frigoribacterium sp. Leaf164 TaxID=1736282 RepID=UPI0006F73327|nr:alpha/beta hydrolase-fold protein [Frigoribacterium sp. Leaf164]KQR44366.1 hypothetical protein ASF82_12950 [Frigoribacterium sp. Leaf164]